MMAGMEAPQGRGRSARIDEERVERRRRAGGVGRTAKLAIPPEIAADLASRGLEARWINDVNNRMVETTQHDDWTPVEGVEPRIVGDDRRTGQKIKAHLCAKPKSFLAADRREQMDRIAEQEGAIVRGVPAGGDGVLNEGAYKPNDMNRIANTS